MGVAGVACPFVVQAREQLALHQPQRLLGLACGDQLLEGQRVHPGALQADRLARGHEVPLGGLAEGAPDGRERGAQARAGGSRRSPSASIPSSPTRRTRSMVAASLTRFDGALTAA
jgi:hypothetical protein